MKKLYWKCAIFVQGLSMVIILLVSVSCKSLESVPQITRMDTDKHESHVLQRVDTIYRHDSVYVREVMRGDTVYLTRTEWRDRWRTRLVHDTIHDTQYITKTIEHPPERYVPKFYKTSTILFYLLILVIIGCVFIKLRLR